MRDRAVTRSRGSRWGVPRATRRLAATLAASMLVVACGGATGPDPEQLDTAVDAPERTDEQPETEGDPGRLPRDDAEVEREEEDDRDDGDADEREQDERSEEATDEQTQPRRSRTVAWILGLGPSAPTGPSAFRAYALLERVECQGILDRLDQDDHPDPLALGTASEDLYRATALACVAGVEDRPELWADAEALAARAGAGTGSCLDLTTRAILDGLLAARRADPDARIEPSSGADALVAPCPAITRLTPDAGPGGTTVRIEGRNLDHVTAIELRRRDASGSGDRGSPITEVEGDDELRSARVAADAFELVVPTGVDPGELCLVLRAVPEWDADGAAFTLVGSSGGDDTSSEAGEDGEDAADTSAAAVSACPPPP